MLEYYLTGREDQVEIRKSITTALDTSLERLLALNDEGALTELFFMAIAGGRLELVKRIIEESPGIITRPNKHGVTPIQIAVATSALAIEQFFFGEFPEDILKDKIVDPLQNDESLQQEPLSPIDVIKRCAVYQDPEKDRERVEAMLDRLYAYPENRLKTDLDLPPFEVERQPLALDQDKFVDQLQRGLRIRLGKEPEKLDSQYVKEEETWDENRRPECREESGE